MTELPSHLRFPARHSLRRRLPGYFSALIAAILITFLWAAYAQVETALMTAGHTRLESAADQVAYFLDRHQSVEQMRRLASDERLRAFLRAPDQAMRAAARDRLEEMATTGPRRVELWSAAGERLIEISIPGAEGSAHAGKTLPPRPRPVAAGVQPFDRLGDMIFSDTVGEIADASGRLGFLVTSAMLRVTPPDIISRLVGRDAVVVVGAPGDRDWTDLDGSAAPPPIDLSRLGIAEYRGPDGRWRVGALGDIRDSPWVAWVELPRDGITAPAKSVLALMVPIAAVFLLLAVMLSRVITVRMTRPLFALSDAAARAATGDYSQRLPVGRRDEVGLLAEAFNAMMSEIAESRSKLEARVIERTAELAEARHEADRANRAKNEFLSLMSHDLRTPLNAILGFGQLLETEPLTADQTEYVGQIMHAGRHLLALISDVLDITRIESGQLALSLEPVGVLEIVQAKLDLLQPMAAARRVRLQVAGVSPGDAVLADRQRLRQILINLAANAVKYNREGGRVIVSGAPAGSDRYRISVTDTGPGIPQSKIDRLFTPFERLGAEQTAVEGTGLGLALSKELAHAMGGTIGVTSVVDQGSTFWIELARTDLAPAQAPRVPHGDAVTTRAVESGVVLYIEDNQSNVRLVERIMQRRPGVRLLHAATGEEGIAMVRERHPDLVLLDLHLPDIGGEEVLQRLWADPATRGIPKIVVTADATPGLARRLEAEGAAGHLTKPLNVTEVLEKIDEVLGARRKGSGDA